MRTTEHIGRVTAINKYEGVVYSETYDDEYYFTIDKSNKNFKVLDTVIFFVGLDRFGIKENAYALRKVYVNSKGINFYSRVKSEHIHLDMDKFLPDIIERIHDTEEDFVEVEFDYPDNIGFSSCVEVTENDNIIYAKRIGRDNHTKFVLNRSKELCNSLFAVFKNTEFGYLVLTIYIGKKAGREPWDKFATAADKKFWVNHALIYDSNDIVKGSIEMKCPRNYN